MVLQNIRLGPQENKLLFSLEGKKVSIFGFSEARKILQSTDSAVWNVLEGLRKKGRIREIEGGKYLLIPARAGMEGLWTEDPWIIVSRLIDVYYVGFWTAMSFWDMTEQIPYTVFVVTTKRKKNRIIEFGKQKFQFVTLSKNKFFGFIKEKAGRDTFYISSREKTIVDGLMHPEYCGGIPEVAKCMWNARKEIDWNTVLAMAKRVEINVVIRRLGYLLSLLEIENKISSHIKDIIKPYPYHFLDPTASKMRKYQYSKDFGLIINRTDNELMSWREH
jgi:predicted transcriptional regulator of viral defense system